MQPRRDLYTMFGSFLHAPFICILEHTLPTSVHTLLSVYE